MDNPAEIRGGELVKRHRLTTRVWHWTNAVAMIVLIMSGLMISNAHPMLYWGQYGANFDTPWLNLTQFSWLENGRFPGWATIPSSYSLADGRHWHLAFAWIFAFGYLFWLVAGLVNRHIKRDLTLSRSDLSPRHLLHEVVEHARLRFPTGAAALRYNTLQKITYIGVMFVLIPLLIATGLCLQPGMSPLTGWMIDLFGGRASARSIHFICMALIVVFLGVHLALVVLAGPINEMRAMITGKFRVPHPRQPKGDAA